MSGSSSVGGWLVPRGSGGMNSQGVKRRLIDYLIVTDFVCVLPQIPQPSSTPAVIIGRLLLVCHVM
jgi:hypothetical protein